ncbi:serine/threonine-protein phosphatase 6 regulatory subunit 3 isoform X1 [Phyllostomus hastatus]|uniref:serine/threonine-protein phosphatase 6 regulatory subunit 3 isoform X1 n=1 Tax=Phyllostomus hastatus TaxID=9423 RepID=UPI001E67FC5D|nr:serine/threonine-protein phosphatase 6 regulatory subunit 3 isoform X1 [Phyllostomus hastatus]XP_045711403.1 serine/threonine-protein phosphatase 6 regulatory subunit 3 isoform X1 [Phyllostomus hastatus]XP_045711404.1 serine/threonine-protein phosphatase 6 regulatory subunit 3 isoform X1 [Phyllostomus hastatus]
MFWKFDLHSSSHIDTLLEREDVTLKELMDEEDVLQECKAQNRKLIEFLLKAECLEDLVSFIIEEPPQDMDEKIRYKYPNISCELLTSDVSQVNDRLGEDESLLMKLYSFLLNDPPLNPLLASFFSKVLSILISRKPEQIVDFLKKKRDFVDLIMKHIGTSAIMDLLLRLLTCIEPPQPRQDVLNWLNEERIIQRLVEIVHPSQEEDRHSNASQSLCEIVRLSRDQMLQIQNSAEPDPLLATLEKQEIIEQLLSNIFHKDKNESAIVSAIQILLTLLETRRPTFEGHIEICPPGMSHSVCSVNKSVLEAIRGRLGSFHELLLEPPKKSVMKTTWGVLDPPVGNTRLNVIRLISSLLQTNTSSINGDLMELNSIGVILDMFFKYTWNNFLHTQVEICIALILSSPFENTENSTITEQDATGDNLLLKHLFQKCQLIERILDAWEMNEKKQAEGGRRHGYMGHLTRIANCIVHSADKGPSSALVQQLLKDLPDDVRERWETFCTSSLGETNKRNTVDLVTTCHIHSSSDDEIDFKETGFSQDSSLQQAFSDYQMQQMTSNFIDQFGFNDEKFADQDDIGNVSFDRVSDINFTLNTNESGNIALFEACCKERIQQFDDGGSDEEDIWEEKHIAFTPESQRRSSSGSTDSEESTDSEDEDGAKQDLFDSSGAHTEDKMEVDLSEPPSWSANFDVPMETAHGTPLDSVGSDVWSAEEPMPTKETGWASFSEFPSSPSTKESLRSNSPVEMETSTEPMDPLTPGVTVLAVPPEVPGSVAMEASSDGEEDAEGTDKVTETVMNGGVKETLSLTVDAKTETAVFKRVLKSYREEGKLSTSQDAACKDAEESPEPAEAKSAAPRPAGSGAEQRTDQPSVPGDASVNGPV